MFETFQLAQQAQGFLMEQFAFAGQAETAPAAMTEHQAQRRFKLAHVGADGRRREVELLLGVGKPLMADHADENA
ncbi:hypothetical protein D3C84_1109460 [compost metagenome]